MSRESLARRGEGVADEGSALSAAATIVELCSAALEISDVARSSSGTSFSDSNVRRLSSTMNMLISAPRAAITTLTHHGRPSVPMERPADWRRPETVGPKALQALAADAAAPLMDPRTLLDGAELASMMLLEGNAKA